MVFEKVDGSLASPHHRADEHVFEVNLVDGTLGFFTLLNSLWQQRNVYVQRTDLQLPVLLRVSPKGSCHFRKLHVEGGDGVSNQNKGVFVD